MKYNLFLFIGLLPLCCLAQSISGKITNAQQRSLQDVTISLKRDSTLLKITVSDSGGNFYFDHLPINVAYNLAFSLVGYEKRDTTIFFTKDFKLSTVLQLHVNQLKMAVVNGRKRLIERKVDRLVYNVENNVNTVGLDALDLLNKTPLVRVDDNAISLVGKNGVSVMIDDKIIHLSGESLTALLKSINAESVTRIEVITNPPAQYEAEGNSGLFNIVTKKIKTPGFYGIAIGDFSKATYNTHYEGLNLNYNYKSLLIFGGVTHSKGSRAPSFEKNTFYDTQTWIENSDMKEFTDFTQGSFGVEWLISPKTTLGMSYNGSNSKPNVTSKNHTDIFNKNTGLSDSTILLENFYRKRFISNTANLHFKHSIDSLGKEVVIDVDFFGAKSDISGNLSNSNYLPNGQLAPNSSTHFISGYAQNTNGYSVNGVFNIPVKKSTFSVGGKSSIVHDKSDVTLFKKINTGNVGDTALSNKFNYNENIYALFTNFNTSFGKWQIQTGLRGEYTETMGFSPTVKTGNKTSYFNVFPTFYLTYLLNAVNTLSFNFGRRIGRPGYSAFTPFITYQTVYSYGSGDPYLKSSYSNNFELSHVYKNILSTTLSYSRTNNMASSISLVQNGSNQQVNVTGNFFSASNYVLNESLDIFIVKWLESVNELSLYYTATTSSLFSTRSNVNGTGADFRSANSIFINKSKTFVCGVDFTYNFPNVSGINNFRKYYYVDLSTGYLFHKKKLHLTAEARDIFKTKKVSYYYVVNQVEVFSAANNDSRRFIVNATYTFGNSKLRKGKSHSEINEEQGRAGH